VAHLFLRVRWALCEIVGSRVPTSALLAQDSKPLLALLTAVGLCDTMACWRDWYRKDEDEYRSNPLWEDNGICRNAGTEGETIDLYYPWTCSLCLQTKKFGSLEESLPHLSQEKHQRRICENTTSSLQHYRSVHQGLGRCRRGCRVSNPHHCHQSGRGSPPRHRSRRVFHRHQRHSLRATAGF